MEEAVATIINGIFSEYGALVGGLILIVIYQAKRIDKLETKNDTLEAEIRTTLSGVITQNTVTFQRVENAIQPRLPFPQQQIEYYPEGDPPPRRPRRKGATE